MGLDIGQIVRLEQDEAIEAVTRPVEGTKIRGIILRAGLNFERGRPKACGSTVGPIEADTPPA